MNTVVAMPTIYRGYRFRSRLEARWAMFFDKVGAKWEFEPQPIVVNGEPYLPDFAVSAEIDYPHGRMSQSIVHEVKPLNEISRIKPVNVYLAGKMGQEDNWRGFLPTEDYNEWRAQLVSMSKIPFFCVGPFNSKIPHSGIPFTEGLHYSNGSQKIIMQKCIAAIRAADIFCAHISTVDAYGTLVEIGMAAAMGKQISLTIDVEVLADTMKRSRKYGHILGHDLWFAEELSHALCHVSGFDDAQEVHAKAIASLTTREFRLVAGLCISRQPATISFGDPLDVAETPNCIPYKHSLISNLCSQNLAAAQAVRAHRFDRH